MTGMPAVERGRVETPGRLIAVEGVDAAGKSTQARLLADSLSADATFQFGATDIGAMIRRILVDPANGGLDHHAEALLIIADKAQHVAEVVAPALRSGRDVVSDRFTASTLAYQGFGRGLDLEMLRKIMNYATRGVEPCLNVLLEVRPEIAARRLGLELDRFEAEGDGFRDRVRLGYRTLAHSEPDRWVVVDAEGSVDEVAERVLASVSQRLRAL